MDQRGDEVHTSTTEASAGSKEGVVRWVLIIGLILAIGLLTVIWVTGAFTQPAEVRHENVSREIAAEEAAEADRGEPITPALGDDSTSASTSTTASQATPGDAPAGDPKPDAQ